MPKVSIILPVYNGADTIARSVQSVLSQTYKDWEIIIIDDASTDNTEQVVSELNLGVNQLVYIKNSVNLGIQKTLNEGIERAKGEFIARIDDDDEWNEPTKLEQQVKVLETNRLKVLVGTGAIVQDKNRKELFRYLNPTTDLEIKSKILGRQCFLHSSVLFRKNEAIQVGKYNTAESTKLVEDYDLWLKLGTVGELENLSIYGIRYTIHDNQISKKHKLFQYIKMFQLAKKYRKEYPNYWKGQFRNIIRVIWYGFL